MKRIGMVLAILAMSPALAYGGYQLGQVLGVHPIS
jgi:hypothetical protein